MWEAVMWFMFPAPHSFSAPLISLPKTQILAFPPHHVPFRPKSDTMP